MDRIKLNFSGSNKLLNPLRQWLEEIEINSPKQACWICQLIPSQCPFERDVSLWGYHLFYIPPLCTLNPLYESLVNLRFRALCFLVDVCGEEL